MKYRTQYHLILDRSDRENPRWVIAKECTSRPAEVPDSLDGRPTKWLGEFGHREFDWMRRVFGRETFLRMTQHGEESFSTRISHHGSVWSEYTVLVEPERWIDDRPDPP